MNFEGTRPIGLIGLPQWCRICSPTCMYIDEPSETWNLVVWWWFTQQNWRTMCIKDLG